MRNTKDISRLFVLTVMAATLSSTTISAEAADTYSVCEEAIEGSKGNSIKDIPMGGSAEKEIQIIDEKETIGNTRNGWIEDIDGLHYYVNDQMLVSQGYKIDGYWYYFKDDGSTLKGWREKEGDMYYYDEEGHLVTNKGLKIDGYWYYLTGSGRRMENEFRQKGSEWFYYDEEGCLVKDTELVIGGKYYKFQSSGAGYLGWDENNQYYYVDKGYRAVNQGIKIDDYWYYFKEDGERLTGWREKEGGKYWYNEIGQLSVNKGIEIAGDLYYFTGSGKMQQNGLSQIGNDWFYHDELGRAVKNRDMIINGYRYIFQNNGAAYQGIKEENGSIIGFDTQGRQAFNAGVKDRETGYWYYFDGNGNMVKNWWRTKADGKYYYQNDGILAVSKGLKIDGYWYYFNNSGRMLRSEWRTKDGALYYYDTNGHLVTGEKLWIDGKWCEFDSSGKYIDKFEKVAQLRNYTYVPYCWGGATPSGWDCSGFTQWALNYLGVSVPRLAHEQATGGSWVDPFDKSKWLPGDLICYSEGGIVSHVAIYLGNNEIIHALSPKYGTIIHDVDYYEWWDWATYRVAVKRYL